VIIGVFYLRRLVPLNSLIKPVPLPADDKKRALKYAITVAGIMFISYFVLDRVEVFLIGLYCSIEDVGFYNLAFRLSRLAGILPASMAFALFPAIATQYGKGEIEKIKEIFFNSSRYLMMIALPIAIGMIALADSIIIFLYGEDYLPAATILQILSVPLACTSINRAADIVIRGINRPSFVLKVMIVFALLKIGLNLWFIPKYGIVGAGVASGLPLLLSIPIYSFFLNQKIGTSWPIRDVVKISIASGIMGLAVYGLNIKAGEILSIFLGIPLGMIIYVVLIFGLRVLHEEDINVLKGMKESVPIAMRKYYILLIRLLEKVIIRR
jgi:O-antigen/teichoic acid export membrane protein